MKRKRCAFDISRMNLAPKTFRWHHFSEIESTRMETKTFTWHLFSKIKSTKIEIKKKKKTSTHPFPKREKPEFFQKEKSQNWNLKESKNNELSIQKWTGEFGRWQLKHFVLYNGLSRPFRRWSWSLHTMSPTGTAT